MLDRFLGALVRDDRLGSNRRATVFLLTAVASLTSCGARTSLATFEGTDVSAGVGGAGPGAPPLSCTEGTFLSARAKPSVLFVLDRSQSMSQSFGTGKQSRWKVLSEALATTMPAIDGVVETGLLLFPSAGGGSNPSASCAVSLTVDLLPAFGQVSAVLSRVQATSPGGATPTADAIRIAASALLGVPAATRARALVLATDGGPDCNGALDTDTCECIGPNLKCLDPLHCLDRERTIARIADYAQQALPTYVIGLQSSTTSSYSAVLDAMADAGGRPLLGAPHRYYGATSGAELNAALAAIRDQIACTYLLPSTPDPAGTLVVKVGTTLIPYDPTATSGWSWGNQANGEILLHGPSCTQLDPTESPVVEVRCGASGGGGSSGGSSGQAGQSGTAGTTSEPEMTCADAERPNPLMADCGEETFVKAPGPGNLYRCVPLLGGVLDPAKGCVSASTRPLTCVSVTLGGGELVCHNGVRYPDGTLGFVSFPNSGCKLSELPAGAVEQPGATPDSYPACPAP